MLSTLAIAAAAVREARWLWAVVVALYVLAFPYHPGLRSPNELCRLWQARALVDFGQLELNRTIRTYGYVGDLSVKKRRYYPSKAPLLSFAAVPIYAGLKVAAGGEGRQVSELWLVYLSRLFLTVLPTLLMLVLVYRFLAAYLDAPIAATVTATYALGTLALSYSLLFMSHQLTAALAFANFYALWRGLGAHGRTWHLLASGAAAGASVATEYTGALAVMGVVAYGLFAVLGRGELAWPARLGKLAVALGWCAVGAAPFLVGLGLYHQAVFGHPLHTGYKYLADAAYQPWHVGGFLGIRYPDLRALGLSFFSPLRGLFTLSPVLLLALPGLGLMWRTLRAERALFWLSALLLLGYTYFTSSFSYASWGWTTGPRHLTPLVPFLLLPVGLFVAWAQQHWDWRALSASLAAGAVLTTGLVSLVNYVPDSVSSPLFGLAMPLFRAGYWPPSVLTLVGAPAAVSGGVLIGLVVLGAGLVLARLLQGGAAAAWTLAILCVAAYLAFLAMATSHGSADQAAVRRLESVWLSSPARRP
jgi:hypothetical protein